MLRLRSEQSTRLRTAALIGAISAVSQVGYDTLYSRYSRTPDKTPFLERMANSRFIPLRSMPDDEYEGILNERIAKIDAEISSLESQIDSLQSQKSRLTA
jgi:hypothetical protein